MSVVSFDMRGEGVQYRDLSIKLSQLQQHEAHLNNLKCQAIDNYSNHFTSHEEAAISLYISRYISISCF